MSMLFDGMLDLVCFASAYRPFNMLTTHSALIWSAVHLPFIMSFVLGAAALSKLVLATDCADANLEDLLELSMEKSEHEIPDGLRWFYCAGLGLALFMMGAPLT